MQGTPEAAISESARLRKIPRRGLPRGPSPPARVLIGLVLVALVLLPQRESYYLMDLVVIACIYATINVSWNLVLGFGGLFTFGQMAFFAIGGYTAALMNIHLHLSPWLTTAGGAVMAGIAGAIIGLPSLRLYGPYMVLFTLAFQQMIYVILVTDTSGFLGSGFGLQGLDYYTVPGVSDLNAPYYVGLGMLALSVVLVGLLIRSPVGVAVQALRDSRQSTQARGVGLVKHRMIIFVVSAMITGVAGGYYAHYYSVITPTLLEIGLLVNLLAMIIIGGVGSTGGVIAGTAALVYLNDQLATQQQYSAILWGAIIIVVVLLMPGGIAGAAQGLERVALRLAGRALGKPPAQVPSKPTKEPSR